MNSIGSVAMSTVYPVRNAPTIDTVSSAVGAVVEQKQIADLPLNGRNFSQLISLAPGANEIPFGATGGTAFFGRQSNFTVSGARPEGQAFLLDNSNIQADYVAGVLRLRVPKPEQAKPRRIAISRDRDVIDMPPNRESVGAAS